VTHHHDHAGGSDHAPTGPAWPADIESRLASIADRLAGGRATAADATTLREIAHGIDMTLTAPRSHAIPADVAEPDWEDCPEMDEADWQHHTDHHAPGGHPDTCDACAWQAARQAAS